jgi:hypothetical protein
MQWYDRPYPEIVYTSINEWQTIDISSLVPGGTVGLALLITNEATSGTKVAQIRKYGSTDDDLNDVLEALEQVGYFVGCSNDLKVDVYADPSYVHFYILGSFTAEEAEFFTNWVDVTGSTTYSWDTRDLSAYLPAGTPGAFFHMRSITSYSDPTGVRKKGSTQDVKAILIGFTGAACGVDANRCMEYYRQHASQQLRLMGYIKQGHAFFRSDPLELNPGSDYTDIDLSSDVPEGAHGVILRVKTSSTYSRYYDARMNGETEEIFRRNRFYTLHAVRLDSENVIEMKRTNSNLSVWAFGYFKDVLPGVEEGILDLELEPSPDLYREDDVVVTAEIEVAGEIDYEEGPVEIETEVISFEDSEYGDVEIDFQVSGNTTQYETREVEIEHEIQPEDKQNYLDAGEVDADFVVRSIVPTPTPPGLTGRNPAPGETRVRRNQPVCFVLFGQNQDQVDLSSISVEINGVQYGYTDPEFSYSGTPDQYEIQINHPLWNYEQVVSVVINANSAMGVPMDEVSYSFATEWESSMTRRGIGRIEIYEMGNYDFDILTIQEDWVRQGTPRETLNLELWYGRYLELPKVEDIELRAIAGATNALGKEVLENGYFGIKIGDYAYVQMYQDTVLHLGSMYPNTHKDIRFKLSIPDGAQTKRYFVLELEITPKMMRTWGRFPWGVGIYSSDVGLVNFHPNKIFYRAYVFDNAMWQGLEQAGIVSSPFYKGEDKQW